MSKPFVDSVVTANDLLDGDVVYQTLHGWTRELRDAEVLTDQCHAEDRLAQAQSQADTVVGAYLTEICQTIHGPMPRHFRETFRATGPSNYHHGKQAEV